MEGNAYIAAHRDFFGKEVKVKVEKAKSIQSPVVAEFIYLLAKVFALASVEEHFASAE